MTEDIQPGVHAKQSLSAHELDQIRALADACQQAEAIDLRLLWTALEQRAGDTIGDLLYYADGLLVGFLSLDGVGDTEAEATGMVHPEYRRRGIFRELIAAAQAECQRAGTATLLCYFDRRSQAAKPALVALGASYHLTEQKMRLDTPKLSAPATSELTIARASVEDAPLIADILASDAGIDRTGFSQHLANNMQNPAYQYYIAKLQDAAVGTLNLQMLDGNRYIYGFVVNPEYRGRGYGRQILERVIAEYPQPIFLEVEPDNTPALTLYQSCGFEVVAIYDYYQLR